LVILLASVGAGVARRLLGDINISLIYIIGVVWVATLWGMGPTLFASGVAVLALDLFFLDSFGARTIAFTDDWLTLLLFLLMAVLTGRLASRARERAIESRRRERAAAVLYELSTALLGESDLAAILSHLTTRVAETFGLTACHIALLGDDRQLRVATGHGPWDVSTMAPQTLLQRVLREDRVIAIRETVAPATGAGDSAGSASGIALYLPLTAGHADIGVMRVARPANGGFRLDEEQLIATFSRQAALAIEKARLSEQARRASALEEADRAKTAVLAAVSHDLRSPLATIKTAATGLLNFGPSMEEVQKRELLRAIDGETDRLSRLVANLLDLSRIQGGALHPHKDWVDVGESLEAVADRLGPRTHQHIEVAVSDELLLVQADSVRLDQVLTNLLENAATYSPPESTIALAAERVGDTVVIRVRDSGPGIPAADRERVFEPFFRGARGSLTPGSGLGLAICRGIVEAHGGTIRVEPKDAPGACIVVTLPGAVASELVGKHTQEAVR
jgi:two-component system sensor histidine kinase KdpD